MIFPKWSNKITPILLVNGLFALLTIVLVIWYWFSPQNLDVGYMPNQPINYSHKLHAGELGIDCRYCHYTVEKSATAAIPPTEVCINCHQLVRNTPGTTTESPEIKKLIDKFNAGDKIDWVKVHNLPQFAAFDHSRHVVAGVSCVECHGRVDQMEKVFQAETLSMGFCLECHNNPEGRIRPVEFVTDLSWKAEDIGRDSVELSKELIKNKNINPRVDCNTCHR